MNVLLTVAQVAERLQCSPSYVRSLMRAAEMQEQLRQQQRATDTVPPRLRMNLKLGYKEPPMSPAKFPQDPPSLRADEIGRARVYLAQVPVFRRRGIGSFHFTLLQWAANARHAAMNMETRPQQSSLF